MKSFVACWAKYQADKRSVTVPGSILNASTSVSSQDAEVPTVRIRRFCPPFRRTSPLIILLALTKSVLRATPIAIVSAYTIKDVVSRRFVEQTVGSRWTI
jgi:hypothetical protein